MKLTAKRKWKFGFNDNFEITDENGALRYTAKGNAARLTIYDANEKAVGVVDSRMKAVSLRSIRQFSLFLGDEEACVFERKEKVIGVEYVIDNHAWEFDASVNEIKENDKTIIKVADKSSFLLMLLPFSGTPEKYLLEYENPEQEILGLLIMLAWQYFETARN